MSFNIVAAVMQHLAPEAVTRFAGLLGIERSAASKAVSAAVPAVLHGWALHVGSIDGGKVLASALGQQDPTLLDQIGPMLEGAKKDEFLSLGWRLLQALTGSVGVERLVSVLGKYAGLGDDEVKKLVAVIAQVVAASLGKYQRDQRLSAGDVAATLISQKQQFVEALPADLGKMLSGAEKRDAESQSGGSRVGTEETLVADPPVRRPRDIVSGTASAAVTAAAAAAAAASVGTVSGTGKPVGAPTLTATVVEDALASSVLPGGGKSEDIAAASVQPSRPPVSVHQPSTPATDRDIAAAVAASSEANAKPRPAPAGVSRSSGGALGEPATRQSAGNVPAREPEVAKADGNSHLRHSATHQVPSHQSEHRNGLPIAAWLLPLVLLVVGGLWWLSGGRSGQTGAPVSVAADAPSPTPADSVTSAKAAAEATARRLADTEAAAKLAADAASTRLAEEETRKTRVAAEAKAEEVAQKAKAAAVARVAEDEANRKRIADIAQAKEASDAKVVAESEARRKAEANAATVAEASRSADIEAKKRDAAADNAKLADAKKAAELEAARNMSAEAERRAAVAKSDAAAEAKLKADAEIEAKRAADLAAEAKRKAEADAAAVAAKLKADADAEAERSAAAVKAKAEMQTCQISARASVAGINVQFEFASATFKNESALSKLVAALKSCPGVSVRIEGHTDNNGDITRNQRLSENRAKSVSDFLSEAGIAANRVHAVGFGQARPLASNDSERGRARNRRIEFVIE